MRANIAEYKAVEEAAMKFVRSVTEGNSSYAKELFVYSYDIDPHSYDVDPLEEAGLSKSSHCLLANRQ